MAGGAVHAGNDELASLDGARVLLQQGRAAEAMASLAEAAGRFSDSVAVWRDYAEACACAGDRERSLRANHRLTELQPDAPHWIAAEAAVLRDLRRFDEADAVLAAAISRLPPVQGLLGLYAWIAQDRAYLPEALRRWQGLLFHFPNEPIGYRQIVQILAVHMNRRYEADQVLLDAIPRFPALFDFVLEYAALPSAFGDWRQSWQRWQDLARRFPDHALIALRRGDAELRVLLDAADAVDHGDVGRSAVDTSMQAAVVSRSQWFVRIGDKAPGDQHRALMMHFESLGTNCEFGLVQRYFGAEPLGLLRWSAIQPDRLGLLLEHRLDGLGDPDNVELVTPGAEYILNETRYEIVMHTFLFQRDTALDPLKLRLQFIRRLSFLKRKMLEDLVAARKIFVYQRRGGTTRAQMARIHQAIRAFGPNTVLFISDAASDLPVGEVELVAPGWLIGSIDRLVNGDDWTFISVDSWLRLCMAARAMVEPELNATAAPPS